ncbi:MAG: hypothetical protein A4S09_08695 [Proteobacteria bacterium SG_bin7]|nr:MAG: hypothetical protein A4S09_08695 [Proteobacteria bacterium SG_bin7]
MDVLRLSFLILMLPSCGPSNRFNQTYQEPTSQCVDSATTERYLVIDRAGNVSIENTSRTALEKKYDDQTLEKKNINTIEPDYQIKIESVSDQDEVASGTWGISAINIEAAWSAGYYGQNVVVGIVDSGLDVNHPALAKKVAQNISESTGVAGVDDDNNGFTDDLVSWNFANDTNDVRDDLGHGTHVAGIVAAEETGDTSDPRGVAPRSTVLPISFLDSSGSGYISGALRALDYAKSRNVSVINASWGGGGCSTILQQKIEALKNQGIVFVAASGNSGINIDQFYEYPASLNLSNQITVGSLAPNSQLSDFSNYGYIAVHLIAPGSSILSTYPGGTYKKMSGTSMATPFVTGAVAILKSAKPSATYSEIKNAILKSVTSEKYPVSSRGKLNVSEAVKWLQNH